MSSAGEGESAEALQPGLAIGDTIDGRYRVVGRLGQGGMGEVVEVEHLTLGRTFALKALRRDLVRQPKVVQRFQTEWAAMAAIRSEHVVAIVDTGSLASGTPYFVMERLAGEDLRSLLGRGRRLPPVRVAELGIDACYGLSALHAAGLVHRDLKPENLFVTRGDDGRDVAKLLDLGVAKILGENATAPGAVIGTARYMAPEQVGEDGAVGPAADVFALAVILYEGLTGQAPFDGDTFERVLFKIMTAEPEPLGRLCPEAPSALVLAIERAMAKAPSERHPTAAAFAASLAQAVGSTRARTIARPPPPATPRALAARRDTTLDESGEPSDLPRTSTPPAHVAQARAVRPASRAALALIVAAALIAALAVASLRLKGSTPDELSARSATPGPAAVPAVDAPAPTPAAARQAPPAETLLSAVPPPPAAAASSSLRRTRRPPAASERSSADPPPVAFDPENPYGM